MPRNLLVRREGQSMIEYALILVLIALFVLLVVNTVGTRVSTTSPTAGSISTGRGLMVHPIR